jgi:hypothetical protein
MRKIFSWIAPIVWFGDEIVRRIVYWAAFIALVSAPMSWVASYIAPIAKYGWGAVVFAGVGAACAITLVICGVLVAWRFFHPLSPPQSAIIAAFVKNILIDANSPDAAGLFSGTASETFDKITLFLDYSAYFIGLGAAGWSERRRIKLDSFDPFEKGIRYEAAIFSRTLDADGKTVVLHWGNNSGNTEIITNDKYRARLAFSVSGKEQHFYFILIAPYLPNGQRIVTILNQDDFTFRQKWEEA